MSSAPNATYRRAILFPERSKKPTLVWVKCKLEYDADTREHYESCDIGDFLGCDRPKTDRRYMWHNATRNWYLSCRLVVYFRDFFEIDGSRVNRSLYTTIGSSDAIVFRWKGPLLTMSNTGGGNDPPWFSDVTLGDFRQILDYFRYYHTDRVREVDSNYTRDQGRAVMGVRISCDGERQLRGAELFVPVEVPHLHDILEHGENGWMFGEGGISPISKLVGLPLRAKRIPHEWNEWADLDEDELPAPYRNDAAWKLFLEPEPKSGGFGFVQKAWNIMGRISNVLLVRDDEEDLDVADVAALHGFIEEKLWPMFSQTYDQDQAAQQKVRDYISRSNFLRFKGDFERRKTEELGS